MRELQEQHLEGTVCQPEGLENAEMSLKEGRAERKKKERKSGLKLVSSKSNKTGKARGIETQADLLHTADNIIMEEVKLVKCV